MTIFRFSALVALALLPATVLGQSLDITPRSPLEAIVLGDTEIARAHLTAMAERGRTERDIVVAELQGAGFVPDRGSTRCGFYGYHRRTTVEGDARSVQVALCREGAPMVLVLDFLPLSKQKSMGQFMEKKVQK